MCVLLGSWFTATASSRPNILLILTDDHGWGDVSTYGARDVQTPSIDALARQGMRFTHMRANATVCSPTRAALLTGRYPDRVGVPGVIRSHSEDSWGFLDPRVPTIATRLKAAGYRTALVGKWHLGLESPNLPNERGFDHFHGFLGDMMDSYTTHLRHGTNYLRLNRTPIDPAGHATDLFADWATDYLRDSAQRRRPFFLYLAFNAPHFPIEPPTDWLTRVQQRAPELTPERARNIALVEHLDDRIGRVLRALDAFGLSSNTLVAFTSDNGGSLPHGQSNSPWRDGKQSHYEGGLRVPFIVRWPGVVSPGTQCDAAGLTFDLFPTLLEAARQAVPGNLDAVTLLPQLRGSPSSADGREFYFVRREGGPAYGGKSYEALIRGDWKLLQNRPAGAWELYNLREDPSETRNRIETEPKIARELQTALQFHIQRGGAVPWQKRNSP